MNQDPLAFLISQQRSFSFISSFRQQSPISLDGCSRDVASSSLAEKSTSVGAESGGGRRESHVATQSALFPLNSTINPSQVSANSPADLYQNYTPARVYTPQADPSANSPTSPTSFPDSNLSLHQLLRPLDPTFPSHLDPGLSSHDPYSATGRTSPLTLSNPVFRRSSLENREQLSSNASDGVPVHGSPISPSRRTGQGRPRVFQDEYPSGSVEAEREWHEKHIAFWEARCGQANRSREGVSVTKEERRKHNREREAQKSGLRRAKAEYRKFLEKHPSSQPESLHLPSTILDFASAQDQAATENGSPSSVSDRPPPPAWVSQAVKTPEPKKGKMEERRNWHEKRLAAARFLAEQAQGEWDQEDRDEKNRKEYKRKMNQTAMQYKRWKEQYEQFLDDGQLSATEDYKEADQEYLDQREAVQNARNVIARRKRKRG